MVVRPYSELLPVPVPGHFFVKTAEMRAVEIDASHGVGVCIPRTAVLIQLQVGPEKTGHSFCNVRPEYVF